MMKDGNISGNKTTADANAKVGGVYLASGAYYYHADFTMESGIIYGFPVDGTDKKGNIAASGAVLVVTYEKDQLSTDFYNTDITKYPE